MLSGCGSRARSELKGKHFIIFFPANICILDRLMRKINLLCVFVT